MQVFNNGYITLHHADARQLPTPNESIDCVVTSPPYWGLRDYGLEGEGMGLESTPDLYVQNMVEVFREVWRVLKPTGTVWLNLGDSYVGTGHKGEYTDPYYREGRNGQAIALNNKVNGLKSKDLVGIPWRVAFALQADGWYLRSDIIWSKTNPMPESVSDRPTKAHEYVFLLTKSPRYYYDTEAIQETTGANKRSVWEIATQPYPEAHFATYSEKLVEPCILAGCPLGGVVLDPFVGSGTTMAVAQRLNRKGVGTDLSTEYLALASKRLGSIALPMNLGI